MKKEAVSNDLKTLLTELFNVKELNDFYLVGGTNLALKYQHRISTDLDFMLDYKEDFSFESLSVILKSIFKERIKTYSISKDSLRTKIDDIKVDFLNWSWIKKRINDIETFQQNWKLVSDLDVGAMKIQAIINRGTKKDFIDIALLIEKYGLNKLIEAYKDKYDLISDLEATKYLSDFFQADLESNAGVQLINFSFSSWEEVKKYITTELKNYLK